MSHNILARDIQTGIEVAWHKLTNVQNPITKDNCGIIYPMELQRLNLPNGNATDFYCVTSQDDGLSIGGVVTDGYRLIDNGQVWDMVTDALGGTSYEVVSVGTIGNRERGFISIKLDKNIVAGGRETMTNLNVLWGHGGKGTVQARTGTTVVVCANTFAMALREGRGDFTFRVKHTTNCMPKLDEMGKAIDSHFGVVAEFKNAMDAMTKQACNVKEARSIFAGFVVREDEVKEVSTRANNQVIRLEELFVSGAGNNGRDYSDIFNAATDYYSHESSGGDNAWRQIESSELGAGLRAKTDMYNLLTGTRMDKGGDLAQTIKRGNRVLELVEASN